MAIRTDTLTITQSILQLIAEIDEFKGAWRALGTLAPDRLSALRRVATIESVGSSTRIEGSKLSDREVEKLLNNLEIEKFSSGHILFVQNRENGNVPKFFVFLKKFRMIDATGKIIS